MSALSFPHCTQTHSKIFLTRFKKPVQRSSAISDRHGQQLLGIETRRTDVVDRSRELNVAEMTGTVGHLKGSSELSNRAAAQ